MEGAEYASTYGVTSSGDSLTLKYVTKGSYSTNIGSRTYLMKDTNNYEMFKLVGNEFTFDVDLSTLDCGLNGALYFVSMPQKGQGTPGAKYGTGISSFLNACCFANSHRILRCPVRSRLEDDQWPGKRRRLDPISDRPKWRCRCKRCMLVGFLELLLCNDLTHLAPRWTSGKPMPSPLL